MVPVVPVELLGLLCLRYPCPLSPLSTVLAWPICSPLHVVQQVQVRSRQRPRLPAVAALLVHAEQPPDGLALALVVLQLNLQRGEAPCITISILQS